jgi:hypothetical protein
VSNCEQNNQPGFSYNVLSERRNEEGFFMDDTSTAERSWRNSKFVCALADSERHLGHVVKTEKWRAYDATHLNDASQGFKYLGAFGGSAAGKRVVESSVAGLSGIRAMGAAGGFAN